MSLRAKRGGVRLSEAQRFDWLRLIRSENIGPRTFRALLNQHGGASAALAALPELTRKGGKPVRIASVGEVEKELEAARRLDATFVAMGEADYPPPLREIADAPPLIVLRGSAQVLRRPTAALVGSRNASALGLAMTEKLAAALGAAGFAVASGLARGVDAAAHRASLRTGTIAVLAGGHAKIYPSEHVELAERIAGEGGVVVSEMPIGWEARARDFPRRNRIVSGLSLGVVVVEAARRSGSLITARFAAEQGREVFAVPGHPLDPRAEGPNDLIAEGATLLRGPDELVAALEAMRQRPTRDLFAESRRPSPTTPLWDELDLFGSPPAASMDYEFDEPGVAYARSEARAGDGAVAELDSARAVILDLLGASPVPIDDLLRHADLPTHVARAALVELEMSGDLMRIDGGLVTRSVAR